MDQIIYEALLAYRSEIKKYLSFKEQNDKYPISTELLKIKLDNIKKLLKNEK